MCVVKVDIQQSKDSEAARFSLENRYALDWALNLHNLVSQHPQFQTGFVLQVHFYPEFNAF